MPTRTFLIRLITVATVVLVAAFAWRLGMRFPWRDMAATFRTADASMLGLAALVALGAMGAKGWGWHLLLRPAAPHRFMVAQEANLAGSAINYLSVAVIGEAARIRVLVTRDPVPVSTAVASVVWARTIEGVALAVFILAVGLFLPLPAAIRRAEIGAVIVLGALVALIWFRGWNSLPAWIPAPLRKAGEAFGAMGSWRVVPAPLALALLNWFGQWATYHLVLAGTGVPVTAAASFTALLASNIGGALRLTPGNVGITQASIAVALVPFGVEAAAAIAAGVILQAVQTLPVLVLALAVVGWKGLRQVAGTADA